MDLKIWLARFKPYLKWIVLIATLIFLGQALKNHWQDVLNIRLTNAAWACLVASLGTTLLAHIWSGWAWKWIIQVLGWPVQGVWTVTIYLKTNIAKYLPGNVWHFVGRVRAVQTLGAPMGVAIVSVVLEPLLMAAAALALALLCTPQQSLLQLACLLGVLVGVHPRFLNPILDRLSRNKLKQSEMAASSVATALTHYPIKPLLGELGFVLMRGAGFLLALYALIQVPTGQWLQVISDFSIAWLLGLVIPGAPGGLGVFEATMLALMTPQFTTAVVLGAVALYRLISTLAEVSGAALAWLDKQWSDRGRDLSLEHSNPSEEIGL